MSNGNAFWAVGKHIVTSTNSTTPKLAEMSIKSNVQTPKQSKKGLTSKTRNDVDAEHDLSNGNGDYSVTPGVKRVSWADDEEGEQFLTLLVPQQENPVVASLETTIAIKDERTKELEATIVTKELRIAELEAAVEESHERIEDLEESLQVKRNTVKRLEKENHMQFVKIQELYRETTEKDDHIHCLESGLKRFTITQEPKQTSISDTQLSTKINDTQNVGMAKAEVKTSKTTISQQKPKSVETPHSSETVSKVAELTATKNSNDGQIEKSTCGPSSNDTQSPTFVTKETLKVVPPAPKPRTLTFPIDLSKYGKKPVTNIATKNQGLSPGFMGSKNGYTVSWNRSPKQAHVKTDAKPNFNPSADIRHMSPAERVLYANGPDVIVKLGDVELKTIPAYILMQCSGKALHHFKANPNATSWTFPVGSMEADAARSLLNWMDEMTYQGRVYSVTLNPAPVYDQRNIQICRAARVMSLNNAYVGHFTKHLCERIRSKDISYDFTKLVCEAAYPENDPVFDCLANKLAMQKTTGSAQDKAVLERLAATYPVLKAKVEKIKRRMGAVRAGN